jgi:hypothetical protein
LITVAYGGPNSNYDRWFIENGSVYRFNLATNTLSMLHAFEGEFTGQPTRIWMGADGMAYGTLDFVDGIYTTAFFRLNPVTGETTIMGDLRELLTFNALPVVLPRRQGSAGIRRGAGAECCCCVRSVRRHRDVLRHHQDDRRPNPRSQRDVHIERRARRIGDDGC